MFNRKTRKIISTIIIAVLVLSMVAGVFASMI